MRNRRIAAIVLAVAVIGATIAATSASARPQHAANATAKNAASKVQAGGVFRVEWESSYDFTGGFDPTGEYLAEAFGIYSNLMVRTLVGYNHVAGAPGNVLVPDLATNLGTVSKDKKTYTFHLKSGIKFGPPLNREITSKDVLWALERIGTKSVIAQYGFYYDAIKGMKAFKDGKSKVISGIKTPDPKTISFTLTRPTGDFLYRLAMPAAGPQPQEVSGCFTQPNEYGRYVISSGPYMFAGSEKLNATSCDTIKASGPISGFDGEKVMHLVRNPAYSARTDSTKARENLPDEFTFTINSNADDIYARVTRGDIEEEIAGETPSVLRQYHGSPQLHTNDGDRTWFLTMNLTQAPFDDLHVRRAMNFVVNREALRKSWGGPAAGSIATHISPDAILNNALKGYAPYGSGKGDLAKAKAEMKQSQYDKNHDGVCDASACKNLLTITGDREVEKGFIPALSQELKSIGIVIKDRVLKDAYTPIQTPRLNIPFSTRPGWGKDYADALTFYQPMFDGRTLNPTGNINYPLVGITPAIAKKLGVKGNVTDVPSINADMDRCGVLSGKPRLTCYAAVDKKLTWDIAPWVPYLWSYAQSVSSQNVTQFGFDQFGGTIAWAHVAVKS
ncbi:MAG: peptide/nickel transport system substrate-binding protein [Gaiellales bacterium]|nr:peptide/nickel transport system substrate-binding protein [Gaiellales bacterium]